MVKGRGSEFASTCKGGNFAHGPPHKKLLYAKPGFENLRGEEKFWDRHLFS